MKLIQGLLSISLAATLKEAVAVIFRGGGRSCSLFIGHAEQPSQICCHCAWRHQADIGAFQRSLLPIRILNRLSTGSISQTPLTVSALLPTTLFFPPHGKRRHHAIWCLPAMRSFQNHTPILVSVNPVDSRDSPPSRLARDRKAED